MKMLATLALCGACTPAFAQITNPDALIAPTPQQPAHRDELARTSLRSADLQWMWQYAQPHAKQIVLDARFQKFVKSTLNSPQLFWNQSEPLDQVVTEFLTVPGDNIADDNRYLTVTGCVAHFCPDRGLLWVDLGETHPAVAFAAIDWNKDSKTTDEASAPYTMWVFSNRALEAGHFPSALTHSIARWTAQPSSGSTQLQNITQVFVVDVDGTPRPISPNEIGAHNISASAETNQGSR